MVSTCVVESPLPSRPPPSPQRRQVASVLKELRQAAKLSQEELAPRVGLTLAGYRPYEQGRRDLSMEQLPVFAEALAVSRHELAARLGLEGAILHSVYATEVGELFERIPDDEVRADLMAAIRAMARLALAQKNEPPEGTP